MFETFAIFFIRILRRIMEFLPVSWSLWLGEFFGVAAYFASGRRGTAYVNLKAAFGNRFNAAQRKKIILRSFSFLGRNMAEFLCARKVDAEYLKRHIRFVHDERFWATAEEKRKGTVFLTAHFGNWEMLQIISGIRGKPLYVLAKEQRHRRLNEYLNEMRKMCGTVMVQTGENVRDLIQALKGNKVVGVLGDLSGGRQGHPIRFFGRKTTVSDGVFKIARKEQSVIQMVFSKRVQRANHEICFEDPFLIPFTSDKDKDVREAMEKYYRMLEFYIEREPEQWLWIYKRWKYCYTKRILFLHDGRAGHANQAAGIAAEFERLRDNNGLSEYEFPHEAIEVKFKDEWRKKIFYAIGFLFYPWAQGRLKILKFFLEPACAEKLEQSHADIVISAGSSVLPVNVLLSRENNAKSAALMTPPFPYSLFRFDLLLVPEHDKRWFRAKHVVKTLCAPNQVNERVLLEAGRALKENISLRGRQCAGVFIGGSTKSYRLVPAHVNEFIEVCLQWANKAGRDILVTTSRRTCREVEQMLKQKLAGEKRCRLLVIANEENPENVAYGMLELSDIAVVTEDSVSMISEAISAGKKVVVLRLGNKQVSGKHARFQEALASRGVIRFADAHNFESAVSGFEQTPAAVLGAEQSGRIQEKLRELL